MQSYRRVSPKFRYNLLRYVIIFAFVVITPFITDPLGDMFKGVGYGQLTDFAGEMLVCLFWTLELIALLIADAVRANKMAKKALLSPMQATETLSQESLLEAAYAVAVEPKTVIKTNCPACGKSLKVSKKNHAYMCPACKKIFLLQGADISEAEKELAVAATKTVETEADLPALEESTVTVAEESYKKKKKKFKLQLKYKPQVLPWKVVGILTALCVLCVTLITVQIGFNVKLFYDIGEKVTGYELMTKLAVILRNFVKCFFILGLLHLSSAMADEIVLKSKAKGFLGKALPYLFTGLLMLVFGVYDALVFQPDYWLTYIFFYCVFTAIYFLTRKDPIKSFLLILFIYMF